MSSSSARRLQPPASTEPPAPASPAATATELALAAELDRLRAAIRVNEEVVNRYNRLLGVQSHNSAAHEERALRAEQRVAELERSLATADRRVTELERDLEASRATLAVVAGGRNGAAASDPAPAPAPAATD